MDQSRFFSGFLRAILAIKETGYGSFAVALCEGEITGIGRVWADGKAMDLTGVTWSGYPGDEVQAPDPFITAKMGAASTPAYRGTAYVVFEELNRSAFGNRLPQISFEVFRPLADPDTAEGLIKAVTMIPASGEFTYATAPVKKSTGAGGTTVAENLNAISDTADIVVALDRLQSLAPAVESVSLVVAWFGDDLRAGNCKVRPGVEVDTKSTTPAAWVVNGVSRASAFLVSRDAEDRPVYGGTPRRPLLRLYSHQHASGIGRSSLRPRCRPRRTHGTCSSFCLSSA